MNNFTYKIIKNNDLQVPFSPKWSNQDNLDKEGPNETIATKILYQKKVQEMAYFTFEKQEKGKTKPQFLL